MKFLFGSIKKVSSTIMVVGFLARLVVTVLSILSVFTYASNPTIFFALCGGGDLIIFVGALIYFFGEDADKDMKNVYGTILFSLFVNVFFAITWGKLPIPSPLIFIIIFLGVIFELLAACNVGIFVTNSESSTLTKALSIITIILLVVLIVCGAIIFFGFNPASQEVNNVLVMIFSSCIAACMALSITNLILFSAWN